MGKPSLALLRHEYNLMSFAIWEVTDMMSRDIFVIFYVEIEQDLCNQALVFSSLKTKLFVSLILELLGWLVTLRKKVSHLEKRVII